MTASYYTAVEAQQSILSVNKLYPLARARARALYFSLSHISEDFEWPDEPVGEKSGRARTYELTEFRVHERRMALD